jgi:hypothetical protein
MIGPDKLIPNTRNARKFQFKFMFNYLTNSSQISETVHAPTLFLYLGVPRGSSLQAPQSKFCVHFLSPHALYTHLFFLDLIIL